MQETPFLIFFVVVGVISFLSQEYGVIGDSQGIPSSGRSFQLLGRKGGRCVTVHGWNKDDNGVIDEWTCDTSKPTNQMWMLKDPVGYTQECEGLGCYHNIVNKFSQKCLTVGENFSGKGNNAVIYQYTCQNDPAVEAQLWKIDSSMVHVEYNTGYLGTVSYYRIVGIGGLCLSYGPDYDGDKLYMYTCSNTVDQYKNQFFGFTGVSN